MPPKKKQKTSRVPSSFSSSTTTVPIPAQSLDDNDPPVLPTSSSTSSPQASQDPHAVKLCQSLLSLPEQLKQLESGRYTDLKTGPDVFEVNINRLRGSVEVRRLRETPRGLQIATMEARERVADQISKRKQDIAWLREECEAVMTRMERSGVEQEEGLCQHLYGLRQMIGIHKKELEELESNRALEVEVEVERVSTRVEVVKEETVVVGKEKRLVPRRDAGIYVFGGISKPGTYASTTERYSATEDKWELVACPGMMQNKADRTSAVLGDAIYSLGNVVERFSSNRTCWEKVSDMPTFREGSVAGVLNGRIYLAGGHAYAKRLTRFDVSTNRWEGMAMMSCCRTFPGGAVLEGLFYVVGGTGGLRTVERYDPVKNEWELVAAMKTARWACTAAALHGNLYAIGGYDGGKPLSSVERYDPLTNRWKDVAPLTCPRDNACSAVLDGSLYVMGGMSDGMTALSSVERYDAGRNCWERVSDMSSARPRVSCAVAL